MYDVEINGFKKKMIFFYIFGIIFYVIFIVCMSFSFSSTDNGFGLSIAFIPLILVHAAFMFFLPYYMMKRGVKKLKNELEKEFFYYTKK